MRNWLLLLVVKVVVGQERTTEGNWETVTYNPGIGCLPYDGSIVPDCSKYVDPITKQPYFKEHSSSKHFKKAKIYEMQHKWCNPTTKLNNLLGVPDISIVCLRRLPLR